jgi:GDP-L-fucose synthase
MNVHDKIYVAGHQGLVGSALMRALSAAGYDSLVVRTPNELDLRSQADTYDFFVDQRPAYVFLAAARVGGIKANMTMPASFLYDNLMIATQVIDAAYKTGVKKLLFLGSSCIYPKFAPQPMREEDLLTGILEPTNEPYAIAKIAGLKLCAAYNRQYGTSFTSCMPTNLYGPGDTFDPERSHVIPALIYKFHQAKIKGDKTVVVGGSGLVRREFLFVDDLARALLLVMNTEQIYDWINIGTGEDLTIAQLAQHIKEVVGFTGQIEYDRSFPDGTPRKLLEVSKIRSLGWQPNVTLRQGLEQTYAWYVSSMNTLKK